MFLSIVLYASTYPCNELMSLLLSPVTISLFPTSIDLDPIFEKDRDLDRFRFSYRAGRSVSRAVLNTSGGPGETLDRRIMQLSVASASSRRPPLLKSRPAVKCKTHENLKNVATYT